MLKMMPILICLAVLGCSTISPSTMTPATPPELLMRPPLKLKMLPKRLSEIMVSAKKIHKPSKPSKTLLDSKQPLDDE